MSGFGEVLGIARRSRGMTQAELAEIVGVSQVAINRYEAGERAPDEPTVAALAAALGVTERLLRHGDRFRGALAVDVHMRRQKSTKASSWRRTEARLNLLRVHSSFLFEEVSLRSEQLVPTFDAEYTRPEDAARLVRAQWRLPIGPITNLIRWLEAAGCLVFEEDFGTQRIDGLSQWIGDHPVILVNAEATPDRKRLTLAHELAHLVLHSTEPNEDMENQANTFAAEFLMPEAVIRAELQRVDLGTLIELKREWGVSMQALYERAYRMGLVNASARTAFYRSLNARGWKSREPGSDTVPTERPALATHIGQSLRARGLSVEQMAEIAGFAVASDNPFQPALSGLRAV